MGRPSHSRTLSIWTNGQRVGTWTFNRRGEHSLQYDSEWMGSAAGRPLSLSLPFTGDVALKGDRVGNFFDNLLPDSETIRLRIATRFKTEGIEAFDLLQAIGRDCVGAVQLLGEDESPTHLQTITGTHLSDSEMESLLVQTTRSGPMGNLVDVNYPGRSATTILAGGSGE
jgi:serine/threonine-protein kinase HipA